MTLNINELLLGKNQKKNVYLKLKKDKRLAQIAAD